MASWRPVVEEDTESIVAMCLGLYAEDPGANSVSPAQVRRTLQTFRDEPLRGRAVVLDANAQCVGYALLASFWSNELGGEICTIDELYVQAGFRGKGHATALLRILASGSGLWPRCPVALELESTPGNSRARSLYRRLGFIEKRNTTLRLVPSTMVPS